MHVRAIGAALCCIFQVAWEGQVPGFQCCWMQDRLVASFAGCQLAGIQLLAARVTCLQLPGFQCGQAAGHQHLVVRNVCCSCVSMLVGLPELLSASSMETSMVAIALPQVLVSIITCQSPPFWLPLCVFYQLLKDRE